VRWVEVVQAIRGRGVTHVIECGPGKVLAGMVKRIDSDAMSAAVYDPESLVEAKALLQ
jgi:[acyl-carrier-protein] S-malonyltransferase